jgi:hypothetical protein
MFEEFRHFPYWRERRWRPYYTYAYSRPIEAPPIRRCEATTSFIVNEEPACTEDLKQQTDMMRMGLICFVIFMACVLILLARK